MSQIGLYLKLGLAAVILLAASILWGIHEHDKRTIATKVELLTQAGEKAQLDAATIDQLRADIVQSNKVVGGLAAQTVIAYKAQQDATVAAAKASAPILNEVAALKAKLATGAEMTCHDAINEWRLRK